MESKEEIIRIINEFIDAMGYRNDPHVLGCFFYGSYLTGYANEDSDIDLHIVFDDTNPFRLYRCNKVFIPKGKDKGIRFEFFEKPIGDLYLSVDKGFDEQDNAWLSILGTSMIVFDKSDGELDKLQWYTIEKFSEKLPALDENKAKEMVSILDNRMKKVRRAAEKDLPYFVHWYHITAEKILKFYHPHKALPKLQTTKIPKVYSDENYRASIFKSDVPEQEFRDMYMDIITDETSDKMTKLAKLEAFYQYATRDIELNKEDYRIPIESRNTTYALKGILNQLRSVVTKEIQRRNLKDKIIEVVKRFKDRSDVECIYLNLPSDSSDKGASLTIVFNSLLIDTDELKYIRGINASHYQQEFGCDFNIELSYGYDYGVLRTLTYGAGKLVELFNSKILYDSDGSYTQFVEKKGKAWQLTKKQKLFDIDFEPDDFGSNQFNKK